LVLCLQGFVGPGRYRQPRTRAYWYRLIQGENTVEGLTIGGVHRLLAEAGYDMADLTGVAA